MMSAVKRVVLLLLLGAVASNAEPEDCGAVASQFSRGDLDRIVGDWVLVWSVADIDQELVGKISSSHVVIKLSSDNNTVEFDERNIYLPNKTSCTEYHSNMTLVAESQNLTLHSDVIKMDRDGVVQFYNETGDLDFYRTSPNSLLLLYRASRSGRYLLSYRREGHHHDVDEQKVDHEQLIKFAECLKIPTDKPYVYDGVSDFCHKKSAVEVEAAVEVKPTVEVKPVVEVKPAGEVEAAVEVKTEES